jgi:hypothetical protein
MLLAALGLILMSRIVIAVYYGVIRVGFENYLGFVNCENNLGERKSDDAKCVPTLSV